MIITMTIIINPQKEIHKFYSVKNIHVLPADKLLRTLLSCNTVTQSITICFYIAEYECIVTFPKKIMR
jgi:hypothetical protein